jgi:hypothetical protein
MEAIGILALLAFCWWLSLSKEKKEKIKKELGL